MFPKYALLLFLSLSAAAAHGQALKPTGSCSTFGYITRIDPAPAAGTILINGHNYSLHARLSSMAEPCEAPLSVFLGGLQIGAYPPTVEDSVTIPLNAFNVAPGSYTLFLQSIDGRDSLHVTIAEPTEAGNLNATASGISIYPVPASDLLHIHSLSPYDNILTIKIINSAGQLKATHYPAAADITLPVANLPPGTYILQLQTATGIYNERIIVSH